MWGEVCNHLAWVDRGQCQGVASFQIGPASAGFRSLQAGYQLCCTLIGLVSFGSMYSRTYSFVPHQDRAHHKSQLVHPLLLTLSVVRYSSLPSLSRIQRVLHAYPWNSSRNAHHCRSLWTLAHCYSQRRVVVGVPSSQASSGHQRHLWLAVVKPCQKWTSLTPYSGFRHWLFH